MHELPIAHVNVSTWIFTFHHVDPCRCKIYMESEKVCMAMEGVESAVVSLVTEKAEVNVVSVDIVDRSIDRLIDRSIDR